MRLKSDLLTAIGTLIMGIWITNKAIKMPWSTAGIPGPAVFPLIIGTALIVLSLTNMGLSFTGKALPIKKSSWQETYKALWVITCSIIYFFLLHYGSFLLLTPLYILALILGLSEKIHYKSSTHALLLGLIVTGVIYTIFAHLFRVSLP